MKNKWTKETPSQGWYWCRARSKGCTPYIIQIKEDDTPLRGYQWCKVEYPEGYER